MPDFEDKIPISEFSYTNTLHNTDQAPIIQQDGADWDNFRTSLADIGLHINKDMEYVTDLHTTSKKIIGAINELADGGGSTDIISTASGAIVTFNDGGDNIPVKSLVTEITATQAGTGTPSPDNIGAITGFDEVDVVVTGKNIFSSSIVQGALYTSGTETTTSTTRVKTADHIVCKPNTAYAVSFNSGVIPVSVVYYDKDKVYISGDNLSEATFTTPLNCAYVRFGIAKTNTTQSITPSDVTQSQLEEGSMATTYEPFGTTHTITLPDTIYGGSLELVGGNGTKVWSDKYIITNDTVLSSFTQSAEYGAWARISSIGIQKISENEVCAKSNMATGIAYIDRLADPTKTRVFIDALGYVVIRARASDNITTESALKTLFMGAEIIYQLTTPTTFNTTPEQITTLSGTNNIYSNSGDVEVEYFNENADQMAELIRVMTR